MKKVVEEHEGQLSLLLRSVCSSVLQFAAAEEHLLYHVKYSLHDKPTAGTKDGKCTTDLNFTLVESCDQQ